jgi:hypothetical protein
MKPFATTLRQLAAVLLLLLFARPANAYHYGEHRLIGDQGFATFMRWLVASRQLGTPEQTRAWAATHGGVVYDSTEQAYTLQRLSAGPNRVSYGALNGLAGDHAENPLELEEGLRYEQSRLHQILALHNQALRTFQTAAADNDLARLDNNYLRLALTNFSHFFHYGRAFDWHFMAFDAARLEAALDPARAAAAFQELSRTNVLNMYVSGHLMALLLAERAGQLLATDPVAADRYLSYAVLYNSFADHFLQDSFAAGHMVVNRNVFASFTNNKALHDLYNRKGVEVANLQGETWRAYGDGSFNQTHGSWQQAPTLEAIAYPDLTPESERAVQAVSLSLREVWQAFQAAREGRPLAWRAQLPTQKEQLGPFFRQHFQALALIPVPFNTPIARYLPQAANLPELQQRTQLLDNQRFERSRVGNSLSIGIGNVVFSQDTYYADTEFRLQTSPFVYRYQYNPVTRTQRFGNYQVRPTLVYATGRIQRPESSPRKTYTVKGGLSLNADYWLAPRRFAGLYSYLQAGVYKEEQAPLKPLLAPSVGLQLGSLVGIRYYELPIWLRLPAQLLLPLKIRANAQLVPGQRPVYYFSTELDLFY